MILQKIVVCVSSLLLLTGQLTFPAHAEDKSFDRYLLECTSTAPLSSNLETLYIYLNDTMVGLRLEFSYAPSIDDVFAIRYIKGRPLTVTNERFTPPRIFSNGNDACLEYGGSNGESFFTGKIGTITINRIALTCKRLLPAKDESITPRT